VEEDAVEPQLVVEQGTCLHLDRTRGGDVKVQKRRGDAFKICGMREEGEDLLPGPGEKE
jgi:hypothetical protein